MSAPSRRELLAAVAAVGVGPAAFRRALAAEAVTLPPVAAVAADKVTAEMVQQAEWVAGVTLTDDQRKQAAADLTAYLRGVAALYDVPVGNDVPPAVGFTVDAGPPAAKPVPPPPAAKPNPVAHPPDDDATAYISVRYLADLLACHGASSVEITKLYIGRLKKYDPVLKCVVSLTEELALKQAAEADARRAAGQSRGPLDGVPWGAKDLISYPGYKTTWGAGHFKEQTLDTKATVAARLDAAGAVLVAKTTMGALALGDVWFGGTTKNPWNVKQGSSGSSAGSAASVSAGLVGFAIGTETLGSIVSPCTRCGVTGLRPTFGRVSRHGCMALSWSMDKVGPIARSVEDCGLIFQAIHGADGHDATAQTRPFDWPYRGDLKTLRVGHTGEPDRDELKVLKELGVTLVPITLPKDIPLAPLQAILTAEASAAFDDLTRAGVTDGIGPWGGTFRKGRFMTAVEYLRAQRVRTLVMRQMAKVMEDVDLYVGGNDLVLTNFTGHPTVVLPNGLRKQGGVEVPTALTFTGRLWGESELLAVAQAYQEATGHHLKRPSQESWTV